MASPPSNSDNFPRDLVGYGQNAPNISWPNGAKVAINFVLNYEEGAERSPVNGDSCCETYGGEFMLTAKAPHQRNPSMESLFDYGSRAGVWRLFRLFQRHNTPLTVFATGLALKLNPEVSDFLKHQSYDIAGHGWRWIDHTQLSKSEEQQHINLTIETIEQLTGQRIVGWYAGRKSEHTRDLLKSIGGFLYDSDSYADDMPYFDADRHLVIPYTLVCNDFRYSTQPGFSSPEDCLQQLLHTVDYLISENQCAVMTIGLHPRMSGHPGRAHAIECFLKALTKKTNLWIARRIDIANHWLTNFP